MNDITNTARDDQTPWAVMGGAPEAIEVQESRGQKELLNSTLLPTDTGGTDQEFFDLGFVFGLPLPDDKLFRETELPAGWSREGSEHAMGSYIVDERGVKRVSVFYKAAFYDRKADMHLINVGADFVSKFVYSRPSDPDYSEPIWDALYTAEELEDAILTCETRLADDWTPDERKASYQACKNYLEAFRA